MCSSDGSEFFMMEDDFDQKTCVELRLKSYQFIFGPFLLKKIDENV